MSYPISNDIIDEFDENFFVSLMSSDVGVTRSLATVIIEDDGEKITSTQ